MQLQDVRTDFLTFIRYMHFAQTGDHWLENWHQIEVCNALERVILGDINRLIINIPPRTGKTEMAVKSFMAYGMGINPASQFIHASYSKRLASSNTYGVRSMIDSEAYRAVFDIALKDDSKAKDEFQTAEGGVVYASGSGGTITGYGAGGMRDEWAGAIIVDDPLKPDEATSDVIREGVIDWFQNTLESRKNNPKTPIIVVMQRLHENDLSGWLLGGGNGEKWHHVNVPAISDDGSSFWPAQFPMEMLERLQLANPYVFSGQYMQVPTPTAGGDFAPENIEVVAAAPSGFAEVRGWDLASTTNKTSDYTASVRLGIDEKGVVWVKDVMNFRGSPDTVESTLVQTAAIDGGEVQQSIPTDPGQAGVSQQTYLSRALAGVWVTFSRESGDKRTRAMPFASQVNVGNVKMVRGEWNRDFIAQLRHFPLGAYDDMVDAASRAYNQLIEDANKHPVIGMLMRK